MLKSKELVIKKLIKQLNSYPAVYIKKINIITLFCMGSGLAVGIIIDIYFLNLIFASRDLLPLLTKFNFSLRHGSFFFIIAIPIFCLMVGVGIGKGIEKLLAKRKK